MCTLEKAGSTCLDIIFVLLQTLVVVVVIGVGVTVVVITILFAS